MTEEVGDIGEWGGRKVLGTGLSEAFIFVLNELKGSSDGGINGRWRYFVDVVVFMYSLISVLSRKLSWFI